MGQGMRRLLFSISLLGLLGAAGFGVAGPPTRPWDCDDAYPGALRWLLAPNIATVGAATQYVSGKGVATVRCVLNASGRPKNCEVLSEDPPGHGFGRFASETTGMFKAASKDVLGQPTAGRPVCRTIRLGPPTGGPTG